MGSKQLTYVEYKCPPRREQWAKQDAEQRRENDDNPLDTVIVGYATGVAVGPSSAAGALLRSVSEPSFNSSDSSDSSNSSSSSSD